MSLPFAGADRAKHMGELRRGDQRWEVYLESKADTDTAGGGPVRGRLHFVAAGRHRTTGWIFLEQEERDIHERFGEFSAVELWHFVSAISEEDVR
jgi:hypothetical protein